MDLRPYIEQFAAEFGGAAEAAGPEAAAVAERLLPSLEASLRLMLLEAMAAATDEITTSLSPGSVHVRLQGREPAFVVTVPEREAAAPAPAAVAVVPPSPEGEDGGTTRINLRLPDHLKTAADAAASRAGLSANAWLVRAVAQALETPPQPAPPAAAGRGSRITGWVR